MQGSADAVGDETRSPILLVDTNQAVPDSLVEYVERHGQYAVNKATGLDEARTRLASDSVDCVLVAIDPLEDDRKEFVADARTIAPDTPLIALTTRGPETLPDGLVSRVTTVVEQSDDPDNWAFLVEKITASRAAAESERDDYRLYRTLVESAQDGLYRLDANGDVVYANESWAAMLGYDRGEMLGLHASRAMADGELERGQRTIQRVLAADDRESDLMDLEMVTKAGDRIVVSVRFVVLTTEDGAYDGVMGVARDVTERRAREAELERKNERLERFASIVSHDLRNPLTVAEGRVELALEEHDSDHLEAVERAHERIRALIDDLLTLSREGKAIADTEWIDLEAFALDCWRNVDANDATLAANAEGEIRADSSRLRQLLENLMRNAVEHAGDSATVAVGELDAASGFYVADDGPGIPSEERDRIFESGYSTREAGTGFGLSIAKQVAEAHGWTVDVTASDDGGARFEISGVEVRE